MDRVEGLPHGTRTEVAVQSATQARLGARLAKDSVPDAGGNFGEDEADRV